MEKDPEAYEELVKQIMAGLLKGGPGVTETLLPGPRFTSARSC